VLFKGEEATEHGGDASDEGEALALEELIRALFTIVFSQHWLVIKELKLAG
jgi:hypothetical protein